jgi:diamine N-acetyltransferase
MRCLSDINFYALIDRLDRCLQEDFFMSLLIRQAQQDEGPLLARLNGAVQQIHHEAHPHRYKPAQPDDPTLIAWYEQQLARPACVIFVAEVDREAAGYALCIIQEQEENPFRYASTRVHLDQFAVNETHRQAGVGSALLERVVALAREHDADRVTLGVAAFNEAAIGFYQRREFHFDSMTMELNLK